MTLKDRAVVFACAVGWSGDSFVIERLKELGRSADCELCFIEASTEEFGNVLVSDFDIETKYYSATTQICVGSASLLSNAKFLPRVEAVLLFYQPESAIGFAALKQAERAMRKLQLDTDIRLLICECVKNKRSELIAWTAEHDFELVELTFDTDGTQSDELPESDTEEEPEYFKEKFGIERVLEALQCHRWVTATYKQPKHPAVDGSVLRQPETSREHAAVCSSSSSSSTTKEGALAPVGEAANVADQARNGHTRDNDEFAQSEREADEFESLFEKFGEMKRVAASLKGTERFEYAEQMTKLFWNALGTGIDLHESEASDVCSDSD